MGRKKTRLQGVGKKSAGKKKFEKQIKRLGQITNANVRQQGQRSLKLSSEISKEVAPVPERGLLTGEGRRKLGISSFSNPGSAGSGTV